MIFEKLDVKKVDAPSYGNSTSSTPVNLCQEVSLEKKRPSTTYTRIWDNN